MYIMTDMHASASITNVKNNKSKAPNVVRAILMVLYEIETVKVLEELVKKTATSALDIGESYYSNSSDFNNHVGKTIFFVTLIKDKDNSLKDKCDLLITGLNHIKDTSLNNQAMSNIEEVMSLSVSQQEVISEIRIKDKTSVMSTQSHHKTVRVVDEVHLVKRQAHEISHGKEDVNIRQSSRKSEILSHISNTPQSIKDIASKVLGCSEKTVQRELNSLLEERVIVRIGEKRWSKYLLA